LLLKSLEALNVNGQEFIKFLQNSSKQEVKHCVLRTISLLILFRIRKNYYSSGKNLLLYIFIKWPRNLVFIEKYDT
jgi:hypothetical protein